MPYTIEQTDTTLRRSTAAIRYTLSFPNAAQHRVNVRMAVDTDMGAIELALPNWLPGSYRIRDFVSRISDFSVATTKGAPLQFEWVAKNRIRVQTAGTATVVATYTCYGNERSVRNVHINRFHAFINPAACLFSVAGRSNEVHHVVLEHEWSQVSTALSPAGKGRLAALNYDCLVDSPIEIGDHFVAHFDSWGAKHEIAIAGQGDFDREWIVEQVKTIVQTEGKLFGGVPYDRYVFIIQLVPGGGGGLEHARSSVNLIEPYEYNDREKALRLLTLLCHEYFHVWNVKRIRPVELGPFDYDAENHTRMLWLAEGVTSYYDNLLAYRCGFLTRDEFLKTLSTGQLQRLEDNPGRLSMSVKDSSYLAWVKLYAPTADAVNMFPSYYLKGGIIFLLVDLWIIARSNGSHSLDDGMRALMNRYDENRARGVTEDEFIEIVSKSTGVDIGPKLREWLGDAAELPIEELARPVGLGWQPKEKEEKPKFGDDRAFVEYPPDRWVGFTPEETKSGLKIARVLKGSPAEAAGLGAEDELIAVNGTRITTTREFEAFVRGHRTGRLEIMAASEGRIYTAKLKPATRRLKELRVREDLSEDEQARLEKWLAR